MCTLTVAWRTFPDTPLVVAANRDERVGRAASPPARVEGDPAVVAPRDEAAGGTWIGYNEHGLFAAVTNRWTDDDREGERSRGLLVRDVLRAPTAAAAARLVAEAVDRHRYAGFNLLVADGLAGVDDPPGFSVPDRAGARAGGAGGAGVASGPAGGPDAAGDPVSAILLEYDGGLRPRTLEPGVHVVVNVGADGEYVLPRSGSGPGPEAGRRQAGNADRLRAHLAPDPGETGAEWRERARAAIADHGFGVCVHGDGFGTRSSSVLTVGEGGVAYEYADGPPCETAFRRVGAGLDSAE